MVDPRLASHPVVQAEARRQARELWPLMRASEWDDGADCRQLVVAFTCLLSDPSRSATRDWLVRSGIDKDGWCFLHALRDDPDALVVQWLRVLHA